MGEWKLAFQPAFVRDLGYRYYLQVGLVWPCRVGCPWFARLTSCSTG